MTDIQMKILGVRIDNLSKQEILKKVEGFLDEPKFHQIATINPEFILEAQKNKEFKDVLNSCDLNIADGVGIKFAFWRYGKHLKYRMAGTDLMKEILKMASYRGLNVFLAANKDGLSDWEETRDAILKNYPNLKIDGGDLGKNSIVIAIPPWREKQSQNNNGIAAVAESILRIGGLPRNDIVFVNFGAPFQELFINQIKCDNIRLAVGVGGGFDFITGHIRRSPKFLRVLGLEWLWRLIQQPRRWKRIFRAIVIFPIKIILKLYD